MDTSEKRFEYDIEQYLITHGYEQFAGEGSYEPEGTTVWIHARQHDLEKCIYMDVLCEFIAKTQPKEWAKYTQYYGDKAADKLYARLEKVISEEGLISVLRNGITDMGVKLRVCYFKPESKLNETMNERYAANILGCTRQFRYSPKNTNTIDMVLSLNGIPIVAIELKNQFKGQNYQNAIRQYKEDRSSKEFCFRPNHRFLVYFAVDLYEVWMTTKLEDEATRFMPFNQGSEGAGKPGGAGNPNYTAGYATHYLWEEVLQRDSLLDILHRFISCVKEKDNTGSTKAAAKDKIIFPRYHQYDVVRKVLADVKENGAGKNYLIEHSAGSGKSNSIAWIAYRLASAHDKDNNPIFNSVIVVTNRVVLDSQLQDTINSFEHVIGLVECIDEKKHSADLARALNDGKRIIICTIQKFSFAYKDIEKSSGKKFAIIVDEAHQGQNGENAKALHNALVDMGIVVKDFAEKEGIDESDVDLTDEYIRAVFGQGKHENQSFFAFTATPSPKSLEIFGTTELRPDGTTVHKPFHVYSMRQAIEEGFILDVLENYTTIEGSFNIIKISADNPELIESPASRALVRYYKENWHTIAQKTEVIMTNFLGNCRYQIGGKGKAMVVADSRANAVRYYLAIKKYMEEHKEESEGSNVMIAFSGEVNLPELPSEKPYTEATMNLDEKGNYITTDKNFRRAFHSGLYNILVVANKYQTGFDEPLLHSMYVDKKLKDIAAVQTLSRLNRTAPGKQSTFVMDFENTADDIKKAFLPFYEETTMQGDTDINTVYDLRSKIAGFMLYNFSDVEKFIGFMEKHRGAAQTEASIGRLAGMLKPVIDRYKDLSEDERYAVRDYIRKFNGAYSYVTQLVRLHDRELFNEFQYTSYLIRLLPGPTTGIIDIEDKIRLEYVHLEKTFEGRIKLYNDKSIVYVPAGSPAPMVPNKKKDTLQNIIDKVNTKFGSDNNWRETAEDIYNMFMKDPDLKKMKEFARDNSEKMFNESWFMGKFNKITTQYCLDKDNGNEAAKELIMNADFYQILQNVMAAELYRSLRVD